MEALQIYRQKVEEQPACDDTWFGQAIARFRAGDELAGREISGSCLRLALEIAETRAAEFAGLSVLDLAQEGNVGLIEAIQSYQGHSVAGFIQHARRCINQRLEEIEA